MRVGINGATMHPWPLEVQIAKASSAGFEGLEIWRDKLEEIAATPVERLGAIHVNDGEDLPREELNDFKRLYPTLGVLPAAEMLRIPRDQGFAGYVTVEVFRQEYWDNDPDLAAHSMECLEVLLAQVPWEREEAR